MTASLSTGMAMNKEKIIVHNGTGMNLNVQANHINNLQV